LTLHPIHGSQCGAPGLIWLFAGSEFVRNKLIEVKAKFFFEFLLDAIPAKD
jgi:hypothetical protein